MEDLFFQNIDKYVYDECTEEEMKLFEKHMETCEKCREEYELSCSVKNAMNSMNTIMPPADFSKLVNERLDRELATPKKTPLLAPGYRKYSAVAACLVLAAVLGAEELNVSEPVVIESSTITEQALQPVPEREESDTVVNETVPSTPVAAPEQKAADSTASTSNTSALKPAVTVSTPAPAEKAQPMADKDVDAISKIPSHLNPANQVVLASSVEKTYEISGVRSEDIPKKERDLAAEFALLETTKSGEIVANSATISSLEGVQFRIKSDGSPKDYGIGSGSLFVSSSDKAIVDELLIKYNSVADQGCYFITSDNFDLFIEEMNEYGVSYQKRVVSDNGGNVAFKLVVS